MAWVDWAWWSYLAILGTLGGIAAWDRVRDGGAR